MKELSTQEKAKTYDGEQNSVNTELDELVIQLEEAIGTSPHSRETIKDFFQKAVQKYMNCLKIANGEIGALVEENYRLKEKQGEQKASNEVKPKFKVGDKIKLAKEPKYPEREIIAIQNGAYYFDKLVHLPFSRQDEWELVEQKPTDEIEPKFKVGDKIRKKAPRSFDTDMEVARIEKDYYICNHIGKFSSEVVPFSAESCYELIEQKASNEVKPKFHEGDWIVFNGLSLFIKEVVPGYYRTVSRTGIPNSYDWDIDNIARRWTIDDAKPGDVLANDHHILILKELDYDWYTNGTPYSVHAYCGIKPNGNFEIGKDNWCFCGTLHMHPATKEQEDQLEKAMADAGYTFDFEKKELNKIEQKTADKIEPKFKVGDYVVDNCGYIWRIEGVINQFYVLEGIDGGESRPTIEWVNNTFHHWTILNAKDGDVLAAHECLVLFREIDGLNIRCYCTYHFMNNPSFHVDTLQNKDAFHPATREQHDQLEKAMADAGYTFDFDKKDFKNIEPKFKVGDWVVNKFGDSWHIDSFDKKNYQVSDGKGNYNYFPISKQNEMHLWTIHDAKDGDVICYKDEISLYKHDIKNCTKQGANFGGFVYYCCYDGKRFIMNNLYSLVEQDKMDIHPASKEQCDRLLSKMREAGYELDADKKKPKFKVGDWV